MTFQHVNFSYAFSTNKYMYIGLSSSYRVICYSLALYSGFVSVSCDDTELNCRDPLLTVACIHVYLHYSSIPDPNFNFLSIFYFIIFFTVPLLVSLLHPPKYTN